MPNFSNDTTWWLLLGALAGWLLFWLIDKFYRRDGEKAGERERAEIESLNIQLAELRHENSKLQGDLDKRNAETKRLNEVSEELRDSVSSSEQQINNLKNALDAAREQQAPGASTKPEDVNASAKLIAGMGAASGAAAAAAIGRLSQVQSIAQQLPPVIPDPQTRPEPKARPAARDEVAPVPEPSPKPHKSASEAGDDYSDVENVTRLEDSLTSLEPERNKPSEFPRSGSLTQRLGNSANNDDLGSPDQNTDSDKQSLLDRLKGSLSGRRPEDQN